MIVIFGAKGNIQNVEIFLKKIDEISKKNNIIIQVIDSDFIYGKNHLISAATHAQRSFLYNTNSLNSLNLEMLLYASGERQITKAIKKIGVKDSTNNFAFVLISRDNKNIFNDLIVEIISFFNLERNDKILNGDKDTLIRFGISSDEIKTVSTDRYCDLILEKVALVDIIK